MEQEEKKLPLPVIIGIAVVALGLAGFVGWKSFGPTPTAALSATENQNADELAGIVKKTNGDISKISPEDQKKLQAKMGGWWSKAYETKKQELGMK